MLQLRKVRCLPATIFLKRAAVWVQGLFNKSKLDDTSKAKGFDSKTYGTAFGIENSLTARLKAGVGYAYSKTDIDGFMRDTDVKTHTAIVHTANTNQATGMSTVLQPTAGLIMKKEECCRRWR